MHDQAKALRGLMEHRSKALSASNANGQTVAITSGKGGVGKSNVALNLAIALAQAEKSVLVMDLNGGVGNIELLCGLNSPWNLSHVIAGAMSLEEILVAGPEGVKILPAAGSLGDSLPESPGLEAAFQQLANFQRRFQFTILDLGTGMQRLLSRFVTALDSAIVVTTAEPTSLAEAYAWIKTFPSAGPRTWEVLINQAASATQAETIFQRLSHTTRAFLQRELAFAGWIPHDHHVAKAVLERTPFLVEHPYCPASQSIRQLTRQLLDHDSNSHAVPKISHSHFAASSPLAAREVSPRIAVP